MNIDSVLKVIRGIVRIRGATDNTLIGNVGDRLKTDAIFSSQTGLMPVPATTNKLRYVDMNAGTGGIARQATVTAGASPTTLFSYSGTGRFYGMRITLEGGTAGWEVQLLIDGLEIFEPFSGQTGILTDDISGTQQYNYPDNGTMETGLKRDGGTFVMSGILGHPIKYDTSVVVKVKCISSNKRFRAGVIALTKET